MRTTCWLYTILLSFALYSIGWADSLSPAPPQSLRLVFENGNQAPTAADDSYSTWQATPLRVPAPGVLANDNDPDDDGLTAILVAAPTSGSLSLNLDGSFSYLPNSRFAGEDSFTYQASDGDLRSKLATVVIAVAAEEGLVAYWPLDETAGTVAMDVTSYANDLSLLSTASLPTWGDGHKNGALDFNRNYAEAKDVPVDQSEGGKNTLAFWMKWDGAPYQAVPIAMPGGGNFISLGLLIWDGQLGITTGNDYDRLGVSFTGSEYANRWVHVAAVVSNPDATLEGWEDTWAEQCELYINGVKQQLTQTGKPHPRGHGAQTTIHLGVGHNFNLYFGGTLDEVRIYNRTLTSKEIQDLYNPWAFDDTFFRIATQILSVPAPGVLENDQSVESRALKPFLVAQPQHGKVILNSDGSFIYTPNKNYHWPDSFTYKVNDGLFDSNLARVTISTSAPVASNKAYTTKKNTAVFYGVSGGVAFEFPATHNNEFYPPSPTLTAKVISQPQHGNLQFNQNGSFTYQPESDYTGTDQFTFQAFDGTLYSNIATASITITEDLKPIPELTQWESDMVNKGKILAEGFENGTSSGWHTYYDSARVFQNIADYTGDPYWLSIAKLCVRAYIERYPTGASQGYWAFTHGLAEDYLRNGDTLSRDMVIAFSKSSGPSSDTYDLTIYNNSRISRDVAYALVNHINAERVGHPRRAKTAELFEWLLGYHLDMWFVTQIDGGNYADNPYFASFVAGLMAEALIFYWDYVDQDPRILEKLKLTADAVWFKQWNEETQSFLYSYDHPYYSDDTNQLLSPLYSWLYLQTGDATYRDRGDKIFAQGVKGLFPADKQFNQNYRWSFDYLKWRHQAEEKLAAARTEEGEK